MISGSSNKFSTEKLNINRTQFSKWVGRGVYSSANKGNIGLYLGFEKFKIGLWQYGKKLWTDLIKMMLYENIDK